LLLYLLTCKKGTVIEQIGFKRQFLVQWFDCTTTIIAVNNFYGKHTVRLSIRIDDYVLAFNHDHGAYFPGTALNRVCDDVHIKYMDGGMYVAA
jgi:hypothetical protein